MPIKNNPGFLENSEERRIYRKLKGMEAIQTETDRFRIGTLNWQINEGHTYLFAFQFP